MVKHLRSIPQQELKKLCVGGGLFALGFFWFISALSFHSCMIFELCLTLEIFKSLV